MIRLSMTLDAHAFIFIHSFHYVRKAEWHLVHNAANTVLCLVYALILTNIELLHQTKLPL